MSLSGKRRLPIIQAGYAAVFLTLLLAAWNPSLPLGPGPVDLLLLLDESNSIDPGQNDVVWQAFLRQANSLPPTSRISLMRFSNRASLEVPWISTQHADFAKLTGNQHLPRRRSLDQGTTAIGPALRSAIQHTSPERHTALLISSDGIDSITPSESAYPVINNNPNLSLYYLQVPNGQQRDLWIESINLPSQSNPDQPLPLSIAIESRNGAKGTLEISLNGRIADKHPLRPESGERRVINLHLLSTQQSAQSLEFMIRDENGNEIDRHRRVLERRSERRLLTIGNHPFTSQAQSLPLDSWQVVQHQPHRLPVDEGFFNRFDLVLIDDLEAIEIDTVITKNLIHAVERSGTGLIVLGGPHSFGNGGYRYSELESLLPLISEASRPLPGAAFLFLLDKSGSMEAENRSDSRLASALRAVSESAKSLRAGDESALVVFDREVEVLLPLEQRADPMIALDQPWQLQPSGGTQLAPALEQAVELLAVSDSQRRFLILVTDGFVDGESIGSLKNALKEAGIQLIALAIGNDADLSTLHKLATISGGRVLQVTDTAELPRFMREELETRQKSWNSATVTPRTLHQAPFISERNSAWRNLQGYQITRAKPSARVYVATDKGDPLLAVGQAGAGRVAALPGGLLESVSGDALLSGLLSWMSSRQHNPNLNVSHHYLSGQLSILVDAVDSDNRWHPSDAAELVLTHPSGITRSKELETWAPGRFATVMEAPETGIYSARIVVGNEQTLYSTYLADDREKEHARDTIVPWLERALSTGGIRRWTEKALNDLLASSSGAMATRPLWLFLALAGYLSLIAFERSAGLSTLKKLLFQHKFWRKTR